ncbi:P-loop containing nucleoside triphosphate hydrolase protein [Kalaharituber pfeilii]|nr:P-loop containing nucleoside triphosphate hydrolase protein [Kalaharituber pfeilii]
MRDDRKLVERAANGEYNVVMVGPEFINARDKSFQKLLGIKCKGARRGAKSSKFVAKLTCIVVDEAHLCYTWREFRTAYAHIGVVRTFFPKAPVLCLSATLSRRAMRFIHKDLSLHSPTSLIQNTMDRPNVFLTAIPIAHGNIKLRKELESVILMNCSDPGRIRKTMIFIDSRQTVCSVVDQLERRLAPVLQGREVIMDYSTILSEQRREATMLNFKDSLIRRKKNTRVLVCTEAAGMGLDVEDIEVVIQWTIPSHLNLPGFIQRAGRCARNPEIQGAAILYYNAAIDVNLSKVAGPGLGLYSQPYNGSHVMEILHNIELFDEGIAESMAPIELPLPHTPIPAETLPEIGNDASGGRVVTAGEDAQVLQSGEGQELALVPIEINEEAEGEVEPALAEADTQFVGLGKEDLPIRPPKEVLKKVDRALLWLTPGLSYSDTIGDIIPVLTPPPPEPSRTRKKPVTKTLKAEVTALESFRKYVHKATGGSENSFIDELSYLSNDDISRIARFCTDIDDTASLQKVLTKERHLSFSPLGPYVSNLLDIIRTTVSDFRLQNSDVIMEVDSQSRIHTPYVQSLPEWATSQSTPNLQALSIPNIFNDLDINGDSPQDTPLSTPIPSNGGGNPPVLEYRRKSGRPVSTTKEFIPPVLTEITDPNEQHRLIEEARQQHIKNEEKRLYRLALNRASAQRRKLAKLAKPQIQTPQELSNSNPDSENYNLWSTAGKL